MNDATPTTDGAVDEFDRVIVDTLGIESTGVTGFPDIDPELIADMLPRLFAEATTTTVADIQIVHGMTDEDYNRVREHFRDASIGDESNAITTRMRQITDDVFDGVEGMEEYSWEGEIFASGDTDFFVMRDTHGAYVYAWPSNSRVNATVQ